MRQSTEKRMSKILQTCLIKFPYWGRLSLKLEESVATERVPRFATDGIRIYYNESYAQTLCDKQLAFVIIHEILHCSLGHFARLKGRNVKAANKAMDYAIHAWLVKFAWQHPEFLKVPENILYDYKLEEDIYWEKLYDPEDDDDSGGDGIGDVEEPSEPQIVRASWEIAVEAAATQAINKHQGSHVPSCVVRHLNRIKTQEVNWHEVCEQFMIENAHTKRSWYRPSKRWQTMGMYRPSMKGKTMEPFATGIDTSGSMVANVIAEALEHVRNVLAVIETEAHVYDIDSAVRCPEPWVCTTPEDVDAIVPQGGGGTDFRPLFKRIEEVGMQPSFLLYITDLDGTFPKSAPNYPVLWLTNTRGGTAPFGQVLYVPEASEGV